jgi:hypothetical protein
VILDPLDTNDTPSRGHFIMWTSDGFFMHGWGWHWLPMLLFFVVLALAAYGLYSLGRSAGRREARRRDPQDEERRDHD